MIIIEIQMAMKRSSTWAINYWTTSHYWLHIQNLPILTEYCTSIGRETITKTMTNVNDNDDDNENHSHRKRPRDISITLHEQWALTFWWTIHPTQCYAFQLCCHYWLSSYLSRPAVCISSPSSSLFPKVGVINKAAWLSFAINCCSNRVFISQSGYNILDYLLLLQ